MNEAEIMEIISDSELINNNYIYVVDFAKMIMTRVWSKILLWNFTTAITTREKTQTWIFIGQIFKKMVFQSKMLKYGLSMEYLRKEIKK